jgi:signal transduction histidine kinase
VRRHEKNSHIQGWSDLLNLEGALSAARLDGETKRYDALTRRLYDYYKEEKDSIEKMRITAREIQSFTENLTKSERADIGGLLSMSMKLLLYALITILLTGIVINWHLAVSISTPIRKLEKITKKVAQGDFSETIEVSGGDEIASLQISFNQMEEMLKDAMDSLEQTVMKLQEKQAQLVEVEKLASIGKLAAGIAHEINNPLTSVLTFSSLLLEQMPKDDPRHERLKIIAQEARRARNIVRQVLSFAKESPLRTERINVNRPVTEIVDALIAQEAFNGIELSLDLSDNLPEIYIDPVQIGQVVLNILLNAAHAITPPGKIHVSTRAADNFIELIISDTGKGIPEEHLKKIFDPFFTTKEKSKGTGLGLAVSYGIIKKHKGDIEVTSADEGSTFIVRLRAWISSRRLL